MKLYSPTDALLYFIGLLEMEAKLRNGLRPSTGLPETEESKRLQIEINLLNALRNKIEKFVDFDAKL